MLLGLHIYSLRNTSFCLSFNFLNFPNIEPEIFLTFTENKLAKMEYCFFANPAYLDLDSISKILTVIMMSYQLLASKTEIWKFSSVICLIFS